MKSDKAFIEIIENSPQFSADDRDRFKSFVEIESVKRRATNYEWNKKDNTIPRGWQSRKMGEKTFLMSPDGHQFFNRKAALVHMMTSEGKEGKNEDNEIAEMKSLLHHEGWEPSEHLPSGWLQKIKNAPSNSNNRNYMLNVQILSVEGHVLDSYKSAIEFMESLSHYTSEDISGVRRLMEEKAIERRLACADWMEDNTVPPGWRVKTVHGRSVAGKSFFLSPEGKQFPCRRAALQFLIAEEHSDQEISIMRKLLKHEGWEESELLPHNWRCRLRLKSRQSQDIHFLTEEGLELSSYQAATEHLVLTGFPESDVNNLKKLMEEHSTLRRAFNHDWLESKTVPLGWKMKAANKHGIEFLLTPEGKQFPSRRAALQFLIKEKHSEQEISTMRKLLKHEDWEGSDLLPQNWRFKMRLKSQAHNSIHFLSEQGEEFKSYQSATEYMILSQYSEEDVENLKKLMSEHSLIRRAVNYDCVANTDINCVQIFYTDILYK